MKRKFLALLTAASMLFGAAYTVSAADGSAAGSSAVVVVASEKTDAVSGGTITYTVSLAEPVTTSALEIHMDIDAAAVDGEVTITPLTAGYDCAASYNNGHIVLVIYSMDKDVMALSGTLFTISFRLKADASAVTTPSLDGDGSVVEGGTVSGDTSDADVTVSAPTAAQKENAQRVESLIGAIGEVTLGSGSAIAAAESAFAALSDTEKDLVSNYKTLIEARAAYNELAAAQPTATPTSAPSPTPTASPSPTPTASPSPTPTAAPTGTPAASPSPTPTNAPTSTPTVKPTEAPAADPQIEIIERQIDAIGEITPENYTAMAAAVNLVRATFDALPQQSRDAVQNIDKLEAAEAKIAEYTSAAAAAAAVDEKIGAIGEVTAGSGDAIASAAAAYNALNTTEKLFVKNYETLAAAEAEYKRITDRIAADRAAAAAVDELIGAIGEVTADSGAAIESAEKAYAELTDAQKGYVTKTPELVAARTAYDLAKATKESEDRLIAAIQKAIANIGEVTRDNYIEKKAAAETVRAFCNDALTDEQKAKITNIAALETAEADAAKYARAAEAAAGVDELIDAIGEVTEDSAETIAAARDAYDKLSGDEKYFVKRCDALTAAEAEYARLLKDIADAAAVNGKIDALGAITIGSGAAIDEARAAYDALSADAKSRANLGALTAAEEAYKTLDTYLVTAERTAEGYSVSIAKKPESADAPVFLLALKSRTDGRLISVSEAKADAETIAADTGAAELCIYAWDSAGGMTPYKSVTINK